jgi:predicted HicB family RNase H-like nuclease
MGKTSKAQLRASAAYIKNLDEFKVRVPKGEKDLIKDYAESQGLSLNAYVNELIRKDMEENFG